MLRKILALIGLPLGVVLAFYLTSWVMSFAVMGLISTLGGNLLQGNEILFNLIITVISFVVIMAILSLLSVKLIFGNAVTESVDNPRKNDVILHLILSVAGFVAYLLLSMLLMSLFSGFSWFDAGQEQDVSGFTGATSTVQLILAGVALIVVAPYFEEAIFRGWLYGNLRKMKVNGILAALVVSIAFGFLHGQLNVAVDTFALSLVACFLFEQTGSIRPAVILHAIKNAIAFYLLFFAG